MSMILAGVAPSILPPLVLMIITIVPGSIALNRGAHADSLQGQRIYYLLALVLCGLAYFALLTTISRLVHIFHALFG